MRELLLRWVGHVPWMQISVTARSDTVVVNGVTRLDMGVIKLYQTQMDAVKKFMIVINDGLN